ncbi:hypothetical protein MU582_12275 [Nocardioidaceae bacterium SCSIO 66511]|nr:hypothetical protein MU582_12275 [Nocardioidaceae bacterium SCSIO 66511]
MGSSSLAWLPWTILLSAVGLFAAWRAYKNGDRSAVVRRLGWAVLPWGLYFMGLIRFTVRVFDAVADWAAGFAFSPLAWLGVGLSVVSVLMIGGGAFLTGRRNRVRSEAPSEEKPRKQVKAKKSAPPADEDVDDIEAILRRHGIE